VPAFLSSEIVSIFVIYRTDLFEYGRGILIEIIDKSYLFDTLRRLNCDFDPA